MRFLTTIYRVWLVCVLAILKVTLISAQGVQITAGEQVSLGVVEVPGETYEWTIYTDYTLSVQATTDEVIWHSPNTGPAILIEWKKSGIYYFTVLAINPKGCMNIKVGLVIVNKSAGITPGIAITVDKNPICEGVLVGFTAKVVNQGLNPAYRWRKNGILIGLNSLRYYDHDLKTGDVISCQLTSSDKFANPINVYSNELILNVYNTIAKFTVLENMYERTSRLRMINQSQDADVWDWDFGDGQSSREENPLVVYNSEGTYRIRLVASNQYNCIDTSFYLYEMKYKGLYIPNAFAPSADVSVANVFKPAGTDLKEYKIEVYDSWGHLIWESYKLDESGKPVETWDGSYKGSPMPQGTYMWKVYAVFRDGSVWTGSDIGHGEGKTMGTVTLIR